MQNVDARITDDVFSVLSVENSVASRTSFGGTAPENVAPRAKLARGAERCLISVGKQHRGRMMKMINLLLLAAWCLRHRFRHAANAEHWFCHRLRPIRPLDKCMDHFEYRDGVLYAEDVNLVDLAETVGTPFYCYSTATLRHHYGVLHNACAKAGLTTR